jgi:hypothetical protein
MIACDDILQTSDEALLGKVLADRALEAPGIAVGDPVKDVSDAFASYTHVVRGAKSLSYKPNGLTFTIGGPVSERLVGNKVTIQIRRLPGITPEQARKHYEDRLEMLKRNMDLLASQINELNEQLRAAAMRMIGERRRHCDSELQFRSKM